VCFFAALYLPQDSWGKLLCNDGGGDPLKALLEGAWVNKLLASSDLIFRRREKADGVKYSKNGVGRTS
jgi:hypothetical protein